VKKTILFLATLAVSVAAALAQNAAPAGNAENGKKLWVKNNCYSCHGYEGHGGSVGPKLAPKPISMVAFMAIVRHPPQSTMPTFTARVISDSDLRDMWAYLNAIPAAPAYKDVPLLNAIQ